MIAITVRTLLHAALGAGVVLAAVPQARAVGPQGTYSDWWLPDPPAEGFFHLDGYIQSLNEPMVAPGQVPFAYFYILVVRHRDRRRGYVGIQNDANGKRAIFSIWGANAANCADVPGAICRPFTGEGDGYQTMVAYAWVPGHRCRTRVWVQGSDAAGERHGCMPVEHRHAQRLGAASQRWPRRPLRRRLRALKALATNVFEVPPLSTPRPGAAAVPARAR